MTSELFGFSMKKGKKISIIVAMVFATIFMAMYVVTGFFKPAEVEVVLMPSGCLSSSIYDAQNMSYTKVEGLDEEHALDKVPFTIDVVKADKASVGDADIYLQEPYHFYSRVLDAKAGLEDSLKNDLTGVIAYGSDANKTKVTVYKEENGYINGCAAKFYVCEVAVEGVEPFYISLYRLHVDKSIYESDYDIMLGVMAPGYTTERLQETQLLAQTTIQTLQYNKELHKKLEKEQ